MEEISSLMKEVSNFRRLVFLEESEGAAKYEATGNVNPFTDYSSRFTMDNYNCCLYPAKNYSYFQGIDIRGIMKYIAHNSILNHAFQLFLNVPSRKLHIPTYKIGWFMGRFLHDSKPVVTVVLLSAIFFWDT